MRPRCGMNATFSNLRCQVIGVNLQPLTDNSKGGIKVATSRFNLLKQLIALSRLRSQMKCIGNCCMGPI